MAYKFSIGAQTLSGSITMKNGMTVSGGSVDFPANSIPLADLNIAGGTNLGDTSVADADEFPFSDGGTPKVITGANLYGWVFSKVTGGDATIASNGALTISAGVVEHSMLNDNIISGQGEHAHADILDADDLLIHDSANAVVKKVGVDSLQNHYFGKVSGDATIADGGALTIADSAVENDMLAGSIANGKLANSAVTITAGDGLKTGGSVSLGGSVTLDIDVSDFAGTGLSGDGSENLNIDASQTGITSVKNDGLVVGRATGNDHVDFATAGNLKFITNNVTRFSVQDSMIQSTVGFDSGGDIQVPAGGAFDVGSAGNLDIGAGVGANNLTLGANNSTVIIPGNLTVQGTTTTVDSTTIHVSSSITFEGPVDAHETTIEAGSPTTDITVLLPEYSSSANVVKMALLADGGSASEYSAAAAVTAVEFALLDGGTARGTTALADGDGFLHNDGGTMRQTNITKLAEYVLPKIVGGDVEVDAAGDAVIQANAVEGSMLNNNVISGQTQLSVSSASDIAGSDELLISDAGTIKRVAMSGLKTFIGSGVAAVNAIGDANGSLAVGINAPSAAATTGRTWTLPNSTDMTPGESIIIKAYGNTATHNLTIARGSGDGGNQEIDGSPTNLVLESDNAAITLYYVATNTWIII